MKNNFKNLIFIVLYITFLTTYSLGNEQFNFDVTEVEITEDGNKYKGLKRGTITTNNGIIINADEFNYDKILNILNASGNVEIEDTINFYQIFSDNITYLKNQEKIFTEGNSKAINNGVIIDANKFFYNKTLNIINAKENVKVDDTNEDLILFADDLTYKKNQEKIYTIGDTEADIEKKYNFISKDVLFDRNKMELSSSHKTKILDDKSNFYELDVFKYFKNKDLLKGKNLKVTTNYNLLNNNSDKYYFLDGFFNLKDQNFKASKTKIEMHKDIFGDEDNDPRLSGVSSFKKNEITQINKGVFTSCKKNEKCPPWSLKAQKIVHDRKKKQLLYDNAVLNIYDVPILYFPKFFHPDPSVERQSGFLKPQLNNSQILGSSFKVPYFNVISENKDLTFIPTVFDNHIFMLQNEFRQQTEFSSLITDYGFTKGYKSSLSDKKKNISHLFSKFNLDLNLEKFNKSDLNFNIQKVTNDTYLQIFDTNIMPSVITPTNKGKLFSSINLSLDHDEYMFSTGMSATETLSGRNSDRYQYILPQYDFSKSFLPSFNIGAINFSSSGSNNLKDTNNLRSRIINDLNFNSFSFFTNVGFKNDFGIYIKNLNTSAKNDTIYKEDPQVELMSMFETSTSLPLRKLGERYDSYITPKISFRFNPGDMKDYSSNSRRVSASNLFSIGRLGLSDTFEEGKSLTLGLDYKKENIDNINKYFEVKLGGVFRDEIEKNIPTASSLNQKSSNLMGSIKSNLGETLSYNYEFSLDNNLKTIEYNSLGAELDFNNFSTGFKFIEENGKIGTTNSLENTINYRFDENNFLSFNTRRNREINFTEYYDFLYEYRNDCLIAGLKYKKTYYQDRDIIPSEDLVFTITIFPLTTYEKRFDRGK